MEITYFSILVQCAYSLVDTILTDLSIDATKMDNGTVFQKLQIVMQPNQYNHLVLILQLNGATGYGIVLMVLVATINVRDLVILVKLPQ